MKNAPLYPRSEEFGEVSRAMARYFTHPGFLKYMLANRFGQAEPDTKTDEWEDHARTIATLPGWAGNARSMGNINRELKAETCNIINGVNIGFNVSAPTELTAMETYYKIVEVLGIDPEKIDLFGYSQGGLTALTLQKIAEEDGCSFKSITTIGTPFLGTPLARCQIPGKIAQDMIPNSQAIQDLVLSDWIPQIPVHTIKTEDHINPESRNALDHLPGEAFETTDHWIHLFRKHAKETAHTILKLIERGEFGKQIES